MQRYIPSSYTEKKEFTEQNAIVYFNKCESGKCYAIGYSGKRTKHDFHFNYASPEKRDMHIESWINKIKLRQQNLLERRAKRKAFRHDLKIGEILYSSWGYEQTNIDFYQVTELVGEHFVKVRRIGSKDVGNNQGHFMSATKIAIKDAFLKDHKEIKVKVTEFYDNKPCIKLSSFESAIRWDGRPICYSWYA